MFVYAVKLLDRRTEFGFVSICCTRNWTALQGSESFTVIHGSLFLSQHTKQWSPSAILFFWGTCAMNSLTVVVNQLKKARAKAQREAQSIDAALSALGSLSVKGSKSRTFSAATRKRMAVAQRARWAKRKGKS
jgi:hypothetical protein